MELDIPGAVKGGEFDSLDNGESRHAKSIEGWILMIRGINEEAEEDDVLDAFREFGAVKNIHLNLDRRTNKVIGYCLIEFAEEADAKNAIKQMNGSEFLGNTITVDWAFLNPPKDE